MFKPRAARWWFRVVPGSVLMVFAGLCAAQQPPIPEEVKADAAVKAAQEQRRLQERERVQARQLQAAPDVRLDTAAVPDALVPLPVDEAPCFHITRLALTGVAAERFQWALKAAYRSDDPPQQTVAGAANRMVNLVH